MILKIHQVPSSLTLSAFLTWWNLLRLNLATFWGSWRTMMSFLKCESFFYAQLSGFNSIFNLANGSSVRRSFQFFVLMLSSSMASYEKTLPVVLIAAMWVLLLKTY